VSDKAKPRFLEVETFTPDARPPYSASKMLGGLEPVSILARDDTTIIATVHRRPGYEGIAALFAAAPEMLEALRAVVPDPCDCDGVEGCITCAAHAAIAKATGRAP
jgi:hypothetical protein